MAKSKYSETTSLYMEGILNTDDMSIEIEDIGVKDLREALNKLNLNDNKVKVSFVKSNDY